MDCSPPGSCVHGILQARIWSGFSCPPPEDLPDPGIEPGSPALQKNSLPSEPSGKHTYQVQRALQGVVNQTGLPCWQKWAKPTDSSAITMGASGLMSRWCSHQWGWLEQSSWRRWICRVCRREVFKDTDSKYETDIMDKRDVFPVAARTDIWNSQRNRLRVSLRIF